MLSSSKKIEKNLKTVSKTLVVSQANNSDKKLENKKISPNVADITSEYHKLVKPFYQQPFVPELVKSIRQVEQKPAYGKLILK